MKTTASLALLALILGGALYGQDPSPAPQSPPKEAPTPNGQPPTVLTTLRGLIDSINALETEQTEARQELDELNKSKADLSAIKAASDHLSKIAAELDGLQLKFEELSTGTNESAFETGAADDVELTDELKILLKPLIFELRKSTEKPREIERLRSDVGIYQRRQIMAAESLASLEALLAKAIDPTVKDNLLKLQKAWLTKQARTKAELDAAEGLLKKAEEKQDSIFGLLGNFLSDFLASRGKSFGLALLGGLATFFLLGLLIRIGERFLPDKEEFRRSLPFRVTRLVLFAIAIFLAVFAFLGVLYSQSDWLLLGLSLIFILGLLWAAKQAILPFYEQLKTVLNLGPVREGERVIFDGIPWEVKSINFYTDLVNPMLTGGHVRVALADLTNLHSRPKARKEPLFPCKAGEWVQLSDGTYGTVLSQTPELVRLRTIPGSIVSYQTSSFLGLAPDNHSESFGLRVPIGIDYQHQDVSTTEVRQKLEAFIKSGLEEVIGAENIKGLWVEFSGAGASSLDYCVGVSLSGAVAGRKPFLTRAIQRLFVDACNKYGWVIPFTQVTIHQAVA